jgi:hypothetical protein
MEFTFVDPREYPSGARISLLPRTTSEPSVLRELHRLCRENRIYDVERWIKDGKPLQTIPGEAQKGQTTSAMEIALESRNQGLLLLLLCNGYDPNLERDSPLDSALRSRRWDLLDLLLEWGAHPMRVSVGNCSIPTIQSCLRDFARWEWISQWGMNSLTRWDTTL